MYHSSIYILAFTSSFITYYRCHSSIFQNGLMYWSMNFLFLSLYAPRCWLINIALTANSILTHTWTKLMEHTYFFHKEHHRLLALNTRTALQHYAWGPLETAKSPRESTIKCKKNIALTRSQKAHLFPVRQLKQEGRVSPYSKSAAKVHVRQLTFFSALSMSAHECTVSEYWFWVTNKF